MPFVFCTTAENALDELLSTMGVDYLSSSVIALETLYERAWAGSMRFTMDCSTSLLASISFRIQVWSTLSTHCMLSEDQAFFMKAI